jgi:hypothetical protein
MVNQSTPFIGASNILHFKLATNVDMNVGDMVTISGLNGSNCSSLGQAAIILGPSTASVYDSAAQWDCEKGQLVLTLVNITAQDVIYDVFFDIVNARCCRTTARPIVSASPLCFASKTSRVVQIPAQVEKQPLHTRCPHFNATISQTNRNPCDSSQINVTFILNAPMLAPVVALNDGAPSIQLVGLRKTLSTAGEIVIYGEDPLFGTPCSLPENTGRFCGNFTGSTGVLTALVRKPIDEYAHHTIEFALFNQVSASSVPSVIEMRFFGVCGMEAFVQVKEIGSSVLSPLPASFLVSKIGQSTPWPGANNTITVTVSSNVHLGPLGPCRTMIVIDGFEGVCFSTGSTVLIAVNEANNIALSGMFRQSNRSVTIEVKEKVLAGQHLIMSFLVHNPAEAQPSPDFHISSQGVEIARTRMLKDNSSVAENLQCGSYFGAIRNSQHHDAEPLRVKAPEFIKRIIGQSEPTPGLNNTLCVTLSSNIDLAPKSVLSLSSLGYVDGTSSAHNGEIKLSSINSTDNHHLMFASYNGGTKGNGLWDDTGKILNLFLGNTMLAGCEYKFCFDLRNPLCGQGPQPVCIKARNIPSGCDQGAYIAKRTLAHDTSSLTTPPFKITKPKITAASWKHSTPYPLNNNHISVDFTANVPIANASRILIVGVTGTRTPSETGTFGVVIRCDAWSNSGSYEITGDWNQTRGQLSFAMPAQNLAHSACQINFTIVNRECQQVSPDAIISIDHLCFMRVSLQRNWCSSCGGSVHTEPGQVIGPVCGTTTSTTSLPTSSSSTTTPVKTTTTTPAPTSSSTTPKPTTSSTTPKPTTPVPTTSSTTPAPTTSSTTRAATTSSTTPVPTTSSTTPARTTSSTTPVATTSTTPAPTTVISTTTPVPLSCSHPSSVFTKKVISQSSPNPGCDNVITVTIVQNVPLPANKSSVIITFDPRVQVGLSDGTVQLFGADASRFVGNAGVPGSGEWNSKKKALRLNVASDLPVCTNITFQFEVCNPASAPNPVSATILQNAQLVNISAEGTGVGIAAVPMDSSHVSIDQQPMRVHAPRFTIKNIGQSSPYPGVNNTISVTIASNFKMVKYTRIVMHGFEGADSTKEILLSGADSARFVSEAGTPGHGTWLGCDNAVVLIVKEAFSECSSMFVVSFVLKNPLLAQDCANVRINATVPSECNNRMDFQTFNATYFAENDFEQRLCNGTWCSSACSNSCIRSSAQNQSSLSQCFYGCFVTSVAFNSTFLTTFLVTESRFAPHRSNAIGSRVIDSYSEAYLAHSENGFDMDHDVTTELPIFGAMAGDACPLLIWPAAFLIKDISQTSPYPCDSNTITITLASNVPLLASHEKPAIIKIFNMHMANPNTTSLSITHPHVTLQVINSGSVSGSGSGSGSGSFSGSGIESGSGSEGMGSMSGSGIAGSGISSGSVSGSGSGSIFGSGIDSGEGGEGGEGSGEGGNSHPHADGIQSSWNINNNTNSSLTLTIGESIKCCNPSTTAHGLMVISFMVKNAPTPQPPTQLVSISAAGTVAIMASPMHHDHGNKWAFFVKKPQITLATVAQDSSTPCTENTISLQFKFNVDLVCASAITITGLASVMKYADVSNITVLDSGYSADISWDQQSLQLRVPIRSNVLKNETVTLRMKFFNPGHAVYRQAISPSVSLSMSNMIMDVSRLDVPAQTHLQPLTVKGSKFSKAIIAQSSSFQGEINTISITMSTTHALRSSANCASSITISGLQGACVGSDVLQLSGDSQVFAHDAAGTVGGTARWNSTDSSVTLYVIANAETTQDQEYVIHFNVTNPASPQDSRAVSISASGVEIARTEMVVGADTQPGVVSCDNSACVFPFTYRGVKYTSCTNADYGAKYWCATNTSRSDLAWAECQCKAIYVTSQMDAAPLYVRGLADFNSFKINSSNTKPGTANEICMTFSTNVPLPASVPVKITVSGLSGASATSGPMRLKSSCIYEGSDSKVEASCDTPLSGTWDNVKKRMTLTTLKTTVPYVEYSLCGAFTNDRCPQTRPEVHIESSGVVIQRTAPTHVVDPAFLQIEAPAIIDPDITQGDSTPGGANNLTIKFTPTVNLTGHQTFVIVRGLRGVILSSGSVPIAGSSANKFSACKGSGGDSTGPPQFGVMSTNGNGCKNSTGRWGDGRDTLTLFLLSSLQAMEEVEVVLYFQNSKISQDGLCSMSLEVVSTDLGCMIEHVPLVSPASVRGTSMQALRIHEPLDASLCFLEKTVTQSTSAPGATNTITVQIRPPFIISSDHTVVISGLVGATTPDSMLRLLSSNVFRPYARWTSSTGSLELSIARGGALSDSTTTIVTFDLANPLYPQESPTLITVSVPGLNDITKCAMETGSGDSAPLEVVSPTFIVRKVGQNSSMPGAANKITVTMRPNVVLSKTRKSVVVVNGLRGSVTIDTHSLPVTTEQGSGLASQASWRQSAGTITVEVEGQVSIQGDTVFSFVVMNGYTAQKKISKGTHVMAVGMIPVGASPLIGSALYITDLSSAQEIVATCSCTTAQGPDGDCTCLTSINGIPEGRDLYALKVQLQCNSFATNLNIKTRSETVARGIVHQPPLWCHDKCQKYHTALDWTQINASLINSGTLPVEIEARGLETDYCGAGDLLKAIITLQVSGEGGSGPSFESTDTDSNGEGGGGEGGETTTPSAIDVFFASMDTDGNECVTQAEFNQNAGQDAPDDDRPFTFEDVARLDGDAACISKEDVHQFMIDGAFASMDTDGNKCVTQAEFNQNAGQDAPAFEDVARLDGDATCISKEDLLADLNQLMNSLQGPPGPPSFEAMAGGDECITAEEFATHAQQGWPTFADVASLDGNPDCISRQEYPN